MTEKKKPIEERIREKTRILPLQTLQRLKLSVLFSELCG